MSEQHTILRSLHDLGLAAWFGGNLMGAVGLNGSTADAKSRTERLRLSSEGWMRWAPIQLAAIGAHGIGSVGMLLTDKGRVATQSGAGGNATVKTIVTVVAGIATLWSAAVGRTQATHANEGAAGVTEPDSGTSAKLASAQRQQKILQWVPPVLTAVLIVLAAQQGEQQRVDKGLLSRFTR